LGTFRPLVTAERERERKYENREKEYTYLRGGGEKLYDPF
jgi:hypothetical protein